MKKAWFFILPLAAMTFILPSCGDDEGPFAELPASVQAYLDANYPGHEIEESELDTLCSGAAAYAVELETSDDEELVLAFNTEGGLLFTEHEIKAGDLPAAVTASIGASYAGHETDEVVRLDMADGTSQYEVELKTGQVRLDVTFAADGSVVCEEEDEEDDDE